ncbi:MAG: ASCH domain-containing protein [Planctomycetes bacterium]|nr:ASCH domain-containing protein [Planctomycetota bacterium]
MLLMKKRFFEEIRAGTKTTTLRYWKRRRVREGSVHTVPGLGKIRIESVRAIDPAELTDRDARSDGFKSVDAMLAALDELYPPDRRDGRRLYRVSFRLLPR